MPTLDIARQRLHNQHLTGTPYATPRDVVEALGAVQAQDYAGAKWAVAQRTPGLNDADLEQAFTEGTLLRTHVMRPTWHFVSPADIRWMLALTAPRVHAINAYQYRKVELDEATFTRCHQSLIQAMQGGRQLIREEVAATLEAAGIVAAGFRLAYLLMHAELERLICSGPRRGKQFTYMLLDERVPPTREWARDEALAELAKRYYTSHGPALLQDYVWWSGLTVADAKAGIAMVQPQLDQAVINDQTYWFAASELPAKDSTPLAHLLPNYDECLASYKDYSASLDPMYGNMWDGKHVIFSHYLVIDGWVRGTWQRTFSKGKVVVEYKPFPALTGAEEEAVAVAAQRFGQFLEMSVVLKPATT